METPATPRTVKEQLVDHLRADIVRGEFAPGEHLRLEEIAARFGTSTMPVREALRDLESEGLVTVYPYRGAVVTELTAEDLQDIYDIRMVLEAMATRLAVPRMNETTHRELELIVEQMDQHVGQIAVLVRLNYQFHSTLCDQSGRRHLCELNHTLRFRTQYYLQACMDDLESMTLAQGEHRAILDACRRGDAEEAARMVEEHVAEVGRATVAFVNRHNHG